MFTASGYRSILSRVGRCHGSCASKSIRIQTDGGIDNFSGPQPTHPTDLFLGSSLLTNRFNVKKQFDNLYPIDMWNAHTIKVPPIAPYCGDITRIKLKFCVRCTRGLSSNDLIYIWNPQPGLNQSL